MIYKKGDTVLIKPNTKSVIQKACGWTDEIAKYMGKKVKVTEVDLKLKEIGFLDSETDETWYVPFEALTKRKTKPIVLTEADMKKIPAFNHAIVKKNKSMFSSKKELIDNMQGTIINLFDKKYICGKEVKK